MLLESRHSVVVMAKVERIAETSSRASSKATTLQHHHDKVGGECSVCQRRQIHDLFFSTAMATMAGCSHVLCIQKFQVYAAMMTGNVIGLGVAFAEGDVNETKFRLSMVGSYFAGTVCARSIEKSGGKGYNDKRHHTVVAPAAVAMFAISDRIPADHQKRKLVLLSAAYGMVYATASHALNGTITQLMTGHVTKLGTAVSDRLRNANAGHWNAGTLPSFCILGSFILGCTFGARIFVLLKQEQPIFTVIGVIYAILLLLFQ
jgi:uncharacterized membrane protein YoaK (UPF0700 family)